MIIIITCGKNKCITKSSAELMYTGSHFKNCLKWAKSKTNKDSIYILSAKYGLLTLYNKIEPNDLMMGDPGCVTPRTVYDQALFFGILNDHVLSTAGKEYRSILDKVFKNIEYPFFNLSLGYMAQAMKKDRCKN